MACGSQAFYRASMPRKARKGKLEGGHRGFLSPELLAEVAEHDVQFVQAMLDPQGQDPVRVPDDFVSNSAVFKAPLVLDIPYTGIWDPDLGKTVLPDEPDESAHSVVGLIPGVTNAVIISGNTLVSTPPLAPGAVAGDTDFKGLVPFLDGHETSRKRVTLPEGEGGFMINNPVRMGNLVVIPREDSLGRYVYEMGLSSGGAPWAADFHVHYGEDDAQVLPGALIVYGFGVVQNEWVKIATFANVPASGTNLINTGVAVNVTRMAFEFKPADSQAVPDVSIGIYRAPPADGTPPTTGVSFPQTQYATASCTCYTVYDWDQLTNLDQTSRARTTALSGLVTYMGDELHNGGQISTARLPPGITIAGAPRGDVYSYLAEMPEYSSDGRLAHGAYAWWCPETPAEYLFRAYRHATMDAYRTTSLWFAMTRSFKTQRSR